MVIISAHRGISHNDGYNNDLNHQRQWRTHYLTHLLRYIARSRLPCSWKRVQVVITLPRIIS